MDIQPDANVEDQDRAKGGKNEAGGMESSGCRVRKHVGNRAVDDRPDDAQHDCPENRNPALYMIRYVLSGYGDVAPITREVLRQAERDPARRPRIHAS